MKQAMRTAMLLALVAVIASPLVAAEGKKKKKNKKRRDPAAAAFRAPKGITFSAEQQVKINELKAQLGPKLAEVNKQFNALLTPDRKKAQADTRKALKETGTKGKEAKTSLLAALNFSDEESSQYAKIIRQRREIQAEIRSGIRGLLTEDQKAQLPKRGAKRKKKAKTN